MTEGAEVAVTIPWSIIFPQIFNFTLLVGLLVWFLRQKVVQHFLDRRDQFSAALRKAQAALAQAEGQRAELSERLQKLNSTAEGSIRQAQTEAEVLKQQILQEAQKISEMLLEDARRTVISEIERANTQLRQELLFDSIKTAQKVLTERLGEPDQRRLQLEFVDKIQVVHG